MFAAVSRIFTRLAPLVALMLWVCAASAAEPARDESRPAPPPANQTSNADAGLAGRPPSPVEAAFSERAGMTLRQFGYDQFIRSGGGPRDGGGAVQDDYRLGPGDALLVTLRGQKSSSHRYVIDSAGLLTVDDVRPVVAQGQTLADLRAELGRLVTASYPNTDTFVSLAEARRITVLVGGAVANPGRYDITPFATLLDALGAAGGVTRSGSLRRIRLIAAGDGDGTTSAKIDLYGLLVSGDAGDAVRRLRDGDRLFVPPLGPTLALAGPLKRPGIYELPPEQETLSVRDAVALAGGLLRPGAHRALRFSITPTGEESTAELSDRDTPLLGDGDLLMLAPLREDRRGAVTLAGHVFRPGPRAQAAAPRLDALVHREDLRPAPYLPFAVLASGDRDTGARTLRAIDLAAVLKGRDRRVLTEGDTLYVLGAEDVDFLTAEPVLDLLRGGKTPSAGACAGLVVLARALAADSDGTLARGPQARAAARLTGSRAPCPPLFEEEPDLLTFALEHASLLLGGVPRPGFYPSVGRETAAALSRAAGAPADGDWTRMADRSDAVNSDAGASDLDRSLLDLEDAIAEPGAVLEPNRPRYEIVGHVRLPGVRALGDGDTLRDALSGDALKRGAYPLMGVIERFNPRSLARSLIPFSPREIMEGRANRRLADGDRLLVFSGPSVRRLLDPNTGPQEAAKERTSAEAPDEDPMPPDPAIAGLLRERVVQVRGSVRSPGAYPVAESVPLAALVATAGGLTTTADAGAVEITDANGARRRADLSRPNDARQPIRPGDTLRINPHPQVMEARAVTIGGAVGRPGGYDIARGERLSSLIARAGGLTEEAYPFGTVLMRDSERRLEKSRFEEQARALEATAAYELQKGETARSDVAGQARQVASLLRAVEPLGRIVVEADPSVLRAHPELDPLLEPDDRIIVPKRPLTVTVSGEVLHPAGMQFISGKTAEEYLNEAGGPTRNADDDRIFLVLPNGKAQPLALSSWNHTVTTIPPGSLIVVPRDPKPFDLLEASKNIGGILGQIAITAASVAVISR